MRWMKFSKILHTTGSPDAPGTMLGDAPLQAEVVAGMLSCPSPSHTIEEPLPLERRACHTPSEHLSGDIPLLHSPPILSSIANHGKFLRHALWILHSNFQIVTILNNYQSTTPGCLRIKEYLYNHWSRDGGLSLVIALMGLRSNVELADGNFLSSLTFFPNHFSGRLNHESIPKIQL